MRTYELTAGTKQIARSSGRSSVSAAAYRAAEKIIDVRTGEIHDFTRKSGIEHKELFVSNNAPEWAHDRATLWNEVERKENRCNSTLAHEVVIGFPAEFNVFQRKEAGANIARERMSRLDCAVDMCYHKPNSKGDERNFHAHMMFTTRSLDNSTKDGWAAKKYRDLSSDIIKIDGKNTTRGKEELKSFRAFVAGEMNRIAQRDGLEVKTEYLSFEERGIEREPTVKMGQAATEMERKGQISERGDMNREIRASNDNYFEKLEREENILQFKHFQEMRALEKQFALETLQEKTGYDLNVNFKGKATLSNENIKVISSPERKPPEPVRAIRASDLVKIEDKRKDALDIMNKTREDLKRVYDGLQKKSRRLEQDLNTRNPFKKLAGAVTGQSKANKAELERVRQRIAEHDRQRKETMQQGQRTMEQIRQQYMEPEKTKSRQPQKQQAMQDIFDKYRSGEPEIGTGDTGKSKGREKDEGLDY